MAKVNMVQREHKRKVLSSRYKDRRLKIKRLIKQASTFEQKLSLQHKLQKMPRDSAECRVRNRCWLTGRSRGYYKDFGLSRHALREMAHECLLPGVTKSSW
nr:ribosomal protein S14 [Erythrotrichia welwitschii]